jgi:hypothetical protein
LGWLNVQLGTRDVKGKALANLDSGSGEFVTDVYGLFSLVYRKHPTVKSNFASHWPALANLAGKGFATSWKSFDGTFAKAVSEIMLMS